MGGAQLVLTGLHGHLGSGQAGEVSTALAVLLALTHSQPHHMLQHASLLSLLLESLDHFTAAQLHQVCKCHSSALCLHTQPSLGLSFIASGVSGASPVQLVQSQTAVIIAS